MYGVFIEKGIASWQILQQEDGYAKVELSGTYVRGLKSSKFYELAKKAKVYAMVSREDTGEPVIWWQECEQEEGNKWHTILNIPAGGLYTIHTSLTEVEGENWSEWGTRGDIIQHIGVGDIYVIAGQSNAAGYGKDFVYDPPEFGVHIYKNNKEWTLATHPLQDSTGILDNPNNDEMNTGHSLYLSFAKYLKRDLAYPIGLIQTAKGGSYLSAWNPRDDGVLYRNMVERIKECGGKIKGVVWYQGCSDTNKIEDAENYMKNFSLMKSSLEKDLSVSKIPFVVFQLSYCNNDTADTPANSLWGTVRDQQRRMNRELSDVYVIPTTDSTMTDQIHISAISNLHLGERAAKMVLTHLFKKNYMCDAPDISYAKQIDEDTVEITFDNVYERLVTSINPKNLAIKAEDSKGIVNVSDYKIYDRNKMLLKLERKIEENSHLHCGYTKINTDIIPIDVGTHMPVLSFYNVSIEK